MKSVETEMFEKQFGRMCAWFNKSQDKIPITLWYERLKNKVPNDAFPAVVDAIIDNSKYFPTPQEVANAGQDWLASHPEKRDVRHETYCPECNSTGHIKVNIEEKMGRHKVVRQTLFRCGACTNWEGILGTWLPREHRGRLQANQQIEVLTPYGDDNCDARADIIRANIMDLLPSKFKSEGAANATT